MSKVIIVTGAGRGLGTDIAREALKVGHRSWPPAVAPSRSSRPSAGHRRTCWSPSWTSPAWPTPEAVDYALGHAAGFRLSSVAEYCGTDEQHGDRLINELQRLLAGKVQAGRLEISYLFDCPSCGNVIGGRDDLPEGPFRVFCKHGSCRAERTIDPAKADAVFLNANRDPGLKSWL